MECKEDIDLFVNGIGGNVVCSVLSSYGRGYRALLMERRALWIECRALLMDCREDIGLFDRIGGNVVVQCTFSVLAN